MGRRSPLRRQPFGVVSAAGLGQNSGPASPCGLTLSRSLGLVCFGFLFYKMEIVTRASLWGEIMNMYEADGRLLETQLFIISWHLGHSAHYHADQAFYICDLPSPGDPSCWPSIIHHFPCVFTLPSSCMTILYLLLSLQTSVSSSYSLSLMTLLAGNLMSWLCVSSRNQKQSENNDHTHSTSTQLPSLLCLWKTSPSFIFHFCSRSCLLSPAPGCYSGRLLYHWTATPTVKSRRHSSNLTLLALSVAFIQLSLLFLNSSLTGLSEK